MRPKKTAGERSPKSPYAKYGKRPYRYSELVTSCIKACKDGRTDDYDRLSGRARDAMLLAQARAGVPVWRWPDLGWTRNDSRFLIARAEGFRERGPQNHSLSAGTA